MALQTGDAGTPVALFQASEQFLNLLACYLGTPGHGKRPGRRRLSGIANQLTVPLASKAL
jgi:hypothetical protein